MRKVEFKFIVCVLFIFLGICYFTENTKAMCSETTDGIYEIESLIARNKVLDVQNATLENYGNIQLYERNGTEAQKFYIHKMQDGYFEIICACSGKLLSVVSKENGANVCQLSRNQSDSQKWKIQKLNDRYVSIISKYSGLYLDICGGINENGTNVQTWVPNETGSQKFELNIIKQFDTKGYTVSTDKSKLSVKRVKNLINILKDWGEDKVKNIIEKSSICFGAYDKFKNLVGFARVITDYESSCMILNVVVDPNCRGKGIGTMLVRQILEDSRLKRCTFCLIPSTPKVANWYKLLGFQNTGWDYMLASSL